MSIYYVDSSGGSNSNNGSSRTSAWASIPGWNGGSASGWVKLNPGDIVNVKPGSSFSGYWQWSSTYFGTSGASLTNQVVIQRDVSWSGASGNVTFNKSGGTACLYFAPGATGVKFDGITAGGFNIIGSGTGIHYFGSSEGSPNQYDSVVNTNITVSGDAFMIRGTNNFTITNVVINGQSVLGNRGIYMGGDNNMGCRYGTLTNVEVHHMGSPAGGQEGGTDANIGFYCTDSQYITFNHCYSHDNNGDGYDVGLYPDEPSMRLDYIYFIGCRSARNADGYGANYGSSTPPSSGVWYLNCISDGDILAAFHLYQGIIAHIYNCLIANFPGSGDGAISIGENSTISIRNCIFYNNSNGDYNIYAYNMSGSTLSVDYCIYAPWTSLGCRIGIPGTTYSSWSSWQGGGYDAHGLNGGTVGFVGGGDYHLTSSSVCIDKGVTITGLSSPLLAIDYDGNTRPSGAAWDMGPYEYGGSVEPPPPPPPPVAGTYYVDSSCTYNGDGTTSTPATSSGGVGAFNSLANVAAVLTGSCAGITVLFKCGVSFPGAWNLSSGASGNPFSIGSYGSGAKPEFPGTGAYTFRYNGSGGGYITFDGLSITNPTTGGGIGISIQTTQANPAKGIIIKNCYFHAIDGSGIDLFANTGTTCADISGTLIYNNEVTGCSAGVYTHRVSHVDIYNNNIHDAIGAASDNGRTFGVGIDKGEYVRVYDNLITTQWAYGIVLMGDSGGNGPSTYCQIFRNKLNGMGAPGSGQTQLIDVLLKTTSTVGSNNSVYNNLLISGTDVVRHVLDQSTSGTNYIYNNTMADGTYGIVGSGGTLVITNNIFYNCTGGATLGSGISATNNWTSGDPLMVSPGDRTNWKGYALQDASPCVNTGTNLGSPYNLAISPSAAGTFPIAADQNSFGSGWEMGCFINEAGGGGGEPPGGTGTTYYVDSSGGSNTNNGTSRTSAWRSLPGQMSSDPNTPIGNPGGWKQLVPGDTVLIKPGSTFSNGVIFNTTWYPGTGASASNYVTIKRDTSWSGSSGSVTWDGSGQSGLGGGTGMLYFLYVNGIQMDGNGTDGFRIINSGGSGINSWGNSESNCNKYLYWKYFLIQTMAFTGVYLVRTAYFRCDYCVVHGGGVEGTIGYYLSNGNNGGINNGVLYKCTGDTFGNPPGAQAGGTNVNIAFQMTNSYNVVFDSCTAWDSKGDGFDVGIDPNGPPDGTPSYYTDNVVFANCISRNNADGYGANMGDNVPVQPNGIFYLNCISIAGGPCWDMYRGVKCILYNCLVVGNGGMGVYIDGTTAGGATGQTNITIKNTIFYNCARAICVNYDVGVTITSDYNLFDHPTNQNEILVTRGWSTGTAYEYTYAQFSSWQGRGYDSHSMCSSGGFHASFVNAGSNDYHPTSSSAVINKGTSLTFPALYPSVLDFDGNGRSGTWDIGPYEYGSTPTCTYSLSETSKSFTSSGGTGTVNVTTQTGCQWTVGNVPSWVTVTSGGGGAPSSSYKILWIGNSFFTVNCIQDQVRSIAAQKGITVSGQRTLFIGGGSVYDHRNQGCEVRGDANAALGSSTALQQIQLSGAAWTHVVLLPFWWMHGNSVADEQAAITYFVEYINAIGAIPVIFNPWIWYYGADPSRSFNGVSQGNCNAQVQTFATTAGVSKYIPVGEAWQQNFANTNKIELYNTDNQHAINTGTYLAAATFIARLMQTNPTGATWLPPVGDFGDTMTAAQRDYLLPIGWQIGQPSGGSGINTGSGTVAYTVASNSSQSSRSQALSVAGQSYTISQAGATAPGNQTLILNNVTYGTAAGDIISAVQIGGTNASYIDIRYKCPYSGTVNSIQTQIAESTHFSAYAGSYYNGNGGTLVCTIYADDGSADHLPLTSSALATSSTISNPVNLQQDMTFTFPSGVSLIKDAIYHFVFRNTSSSSDSNWTSMVCLTDPLIPVTTGAGGGIGGYYGTVGANTTYPMPVGQVGTSDGIAIRWKVHHTGTISQIQTANTNSLDTYYATSTWSGDGGAAVCSIYNSSGTLIAQSQQIASPALRHDYEPYIFSTGVDVHENETYTFVFTNANPGSGFISVNALFNNISGDPVGGPNEGAPYYDFDTEMAVGKVTQWPNNVSWHSACTAPLVIKFTDTVTDGLGWFGTRTNTNSPTEVFTPSATKTVVAVTVYLISANANTTITIARGGTTIGTGTVTSNSYGWATLSFATPITLNAGQAHTLTYTGTTRQIQKCAGYGTYSGASVYCGFLDGYQQGYTTYDCCFYFTLQGTQATPADPHQVLPWMTYYELAVGYHYGSVTFISTDYVGGRVPTIQLNYSDSNVAGFGWINAANVALPVTETFTPKSALNVYSMGAKLTTAGTTGITIALKQGTTTLATFTGTTNTYGWISQTFSSIVTLSANITYTLTISGTGVAAYLTKGSTVNLNTYDCFPDGSVQGNTSRDIQFYLALNGGYTPPPPPPDDPGGGTAGWWMNPPAPALGSGTTYYVNPSGGSDSANGTSQATAWTHLPGNSNASGVPASLMVPAGTTIKIRSGTTMTGNYTFAGHYANGTSSNYTTIMRDTSWGSGNVVWEGSGASTPAWGGLLQFDSVAYICLDGMTPQGFDITNSPNHGIMCNGPSQSNMNPGLVFRNIRVYAPRGMGVYMQTQSNFQMNYVEVNGASIADNGGIYIGGDTYVCNQGIVANCDAHHIGNNPGGQEGGTNVNMGFWITNAYNVAFINCKAWMTTGRSCDTGTTGAPPYAMADNILFLNCKWETGFAGIGSNADDYGSAQDGHTTCRHYWVNCIIQNEYGNGGWIYNGSSAYVLNCVFYNNPGGLYLDGCNFGRHLGFTQRNNIFYYTGRALYYYRLPIDINSDYCLYEDSSGTQFIDYNDAVSGQYYYISTSTSNNIVAWRNFSGNDAHSLDSAYQNAHALFTDAAGGDFTLQSNSSCLSSGQNLTNQTLAGTNVWGQIKSIWNIDPSDYYGYALPSTGAWHMGAIAPSSIIAPPTTTPLQVSVFQIVRVTSQTVNVNRSSLRITDVYERITTGTNSPIVRPPLKFGDVWAYQPLKVTCNPKVYLVVQPKINVSERITVHELFGGGSSGETTKITTTGYYETQPIDLGSVQKVRCSGQASYFAVDANSGDFDSITNFDTTTLDGTIGDVGVQLQIAYSMQPVSVNNWSAWVPLAVGDFTGQSFKFRIFVYSYDTNHYIGISYLKFDIAAPMRHEYVEIVTCPAQGMDINFVTPYLTGPPHVSITIQDGQPGDTVVLYNQSEAGFSVQILGNSGIGVGRTIAWMSIGN